MKKILVLIPLKDGHKIPSETLDSISLQTIEADIICISRSGMVPREYALNSSIPISSIKEAVCLNIAAQEALKTDTDYFLIMHRDVVFLKNDSIECLVSFLETHTKYGAVAYNTREYPPDLDHIDTSCMLIRRYVLEKIPFHNKCGCICRGFIEDMKRLDSYTMACYINGTVNNMGLE